MEDKNYKVVFLGEHGVGKTSLINRYINKNFNNNELSTISSTYTCKTIEYEGKKYTFNLWDTAGTEAFRALTKLFLKDSNIIVLVYDITIKRTFLELQFWLDYILETFGQKLFLVLVGNKSDLNNLIKIKKSDGEKFGKIINAPFIQVSAKNGDIEWINFLDNVLKEYLKKTVSKKIDDNEYDYIEDDDSFQFS